MAHFLEQTWRWFGPSDRVTLSHVRQAGATGVVSALHHVACGELWTPEEILSRKSEIEAAGLKWSVVESLPVHEDIKQNTGQAQMYLERYCQSLRNLAAAGLRVICYNFMAITDWTRTDVRYRMPSGAEALRFDVVEAAAFDLFALRRRGAETSYNPAILEAAERRWAAMPVNRREQLARTILMGLPGTVEDLSVEQFQQLLDEYDDIGARRLRKHHSLFLDRVIPLAEQLGMRLAIHPDDPPFPIFGLPRIAGDEIGLNAIVAAVESPANGITFCTGSLGASASNDCPGILRRLGRSIHFLHLRNVKVESDGSFFEDDHLAGSTDMAAVMSAAIDLMEQRGESLPMRPDHGHRMLGDLNIDGYYHGYSAVGRLRGLAELRGLEKGIRHARGM